MSNLSNIKCVSSQTTPLKRDDLLFYKRHVAVAETAVRQKAKQRLLDRVKSVMDEIDVSWRRSRSEDTDFNVLLV